MYVRHSPQDLVAKSRIELQELREEKAQLQSEVESAKSSASAATSRIASLSRDVSSLRSQLADEQRRRTQQATDHAAQAAKLEQMVRQIEQLKATEARLKAQAQGQAPLVQVYVCPWPEVLSCSADGGNSLYSVVIAVRAMIPAMVLLVARLDITGACCEFSSAALRCMFGSWLMHQPRSSSSSVAASSTTALPPVLAPFRTVDSSSSAMATTGAAMEVDDMDYDGTHDNGADLAALFGEAGEGDSHSHDLNISPDGKHSKKRKHGDITGMGDDELDDIKHDGSVGYDVVGTCCGTFPLDTRWIGWSVPGSICESSGNRPTGTPKMYATGIKDE